MSGVCKIVGVVPELYYVLLSDVSFDVVVWKSKASFDVAVALYAKDCFACGAAVPWWVGA